MTTVQLALEVPLRQIIRLNRIPCGIRQAIAIDVTQSKDHRQNLAIEAWPHREMHVYSTKAIYCEEFSDIEKGVVPESSQVSPDILGQAVVAFSMLVVGILIMIFG